jgi:hypothetical protein
VHLNNQRIILLHAVREKKMTLDTILVVVAVVMMFATFAIVLGWGERQTRKM